MPLIALGQVSGPAGLALTNAVARILLAAGLKPRAAVEAHKILDAYIIGFTSLDVARLTRTEVTLSLEGYPELASLLAETAAIDSDRVFDDGLNVLLEGLLS